MLEELTYIYKPRPWHMTGPVLLILLGYAILHTSGILENWFCAQITCPSYEIHNYGLIGDWFIAGILLFLALLWGFWIVYVGLVQVEIQYNYETTGENWSEARIHIIRNNHKWSLWAKQVLAGRPLSQTLWTGKGKLFSKTEYEKRMLDMWVRGVLDYAKGETNDNGYIIAEGGKPYIRAMAAGKNNLPNPPLPSPTRKPGYKEPLERTHDDAHAIGEGSYND